jgi:hypothetical protein
MSIIPQLLILLSMLVFWVPALAQSEDSNLPPPLVLNDDQGEYKLGHSMQLLEDPGGTLTIQEVSSLPYSQRFETSAVETPNLGFSSSAYWVRFRLKNESRLTDRWLLELEFSNMQYVDLYLPTPDGKGFIARQTGVLRPFNTRDIENHHIVFNLPLPQNDEQTIYMRFQSGASMTLPLVVWSSKAFIQTSSTDLRGVPDHAGLQPVPSFITAGGKLPLLYFLPSERSPAFDFLRWHRRSIPVAKPTRDKPLCCRPLLYSIFRLHAQVHR